MSTMSSVTKHKTILACDPGYGRLGVAILQGSVHESSLLYSTCLETSKNDSQPKRLAFLHNELSKLVETYTPDAIALETLFFSNNQKTVIAVAEARGMIVTLAGIKNIPLIEHSPQQIKLAVTGYGNASKKDVIGMTKRLIPTVAPNALDDEYDAVALSICALASHS